MLHKPDNLNRKRDISFCVLHPDENQAGTASALLEGLDGIDHVAHSNDHQITVYYSLDSVTLEAIEALLADRGFHLDNSLLQRMRRALIHYTEENQRRNLGCGRGESNCASKLFVKQYQQREHGCKDARPSHWRRYL
jgi:hypothetical protein